MGVSTRERAVLKLVHPGRHVEIHREPIAASEIMRKYPRHCIARPDVFKYPYIVVRPESVLLPGKVFYLVPIRTLHGLLKARAQHSQPSCQENHHPQNYDCRGHNTRKDSAIKCWGGKAPKHLLHDRGHRRRLRNMLGHRNNSYIHDSGDYTSDTSYVDARNEVRNGHYGAPEHQLHDRGHRRRSGNMLAERSSYFVQDSEDYTSDTSYVDARNGIRNEVQNVHFGAPKHQLHDRGHRSRNILGDRSSNYVQDSEDYTSDTTYVNVLDEIGDKVRKVHLGVHPAHSSFDDSSISFPSKRYQYNGSNAMSTVPTTKKGCNVSSALSIVRNEDVHKRISGDHGRMKSCIRKKDSVRKFLNLKVSFSSSIIVPTRISGRSSSVQQAI